MSFLSDLYDRLKKETGNVARNDFGVGVGGNGAVGRAVGNAFTQHINQPLQQHFSQPVGNAFSNLSSGIVRRNQAFGQQQIQNTNNIRNDLFNNPNPYIRKPIRFVADTATALGHTGINNLLGTQSAGGDLHPTHTPQQFMNNYNQGGNDRIGSRIGSIAGQFAGAINPVTAGIQGGTQLSNIVENRALTPAQKLAQGSAAVGLSLANAGAGKLLGEGKILGGLISDTKAQPFIDALDKSKLGKLAYYSGEKGLTGGAYNAVNALAQGGNKQDIKNAFKSGALFSAGANAIASPKLTGGATKEFLGNISNAIEGERYRTSLSQVASKVAGITNKNEIAKILEGNSDTRKLLNSGAKNSLLERLSRYDKPTNVFGELDSIINPKPLVIHNYQEPGTRGGFVMNPLAGNTIDPKILNSEQVNPQLLSGETPLLLDQGKPNTVKQTKQIFKKTGQVQDFINELKSNDKPLIFSDKYGQANVLSPKILNDKEVSIPISLPSPQIENKPSVSKIINNKRGFIQDGSTRLAPYGLANVTDRAGNIVPSDVQKAIQVAISAGKDKSSPALHNQTPVRNIEDVFGKDAQTIKNYLPGRAAKNETAKVDWVDSQIKGFKDTFKQLGIKAHSKEDQLAQEYAEKNVSLDELKQRLPKTWQNVKKAADISRAKYDQYLGQINEQLTKYGYAPIPKRKDYVTHLGEISKFGDLNGLLTNTDKNKLPTAMSGIHLNTKPGKTFFKFGQARLGNAHRSSLIDSLDAYIPSAGQQIFHTDTAQSARAFQKALDAQVEKNPNTKALSNFNSWSNDYVNHLTGKGSDLDRSFEKFTGRSAPKIVDWFRRRTSANMVGANISSALTNFIPLTQSLATTSKSAAAKGLLTAAQAPFEKNPDIIDGVTSDFLKRRFGGDTKISSTLGQKAMNGANWVFGAVDKLVGKSIVSGKYYEGLQKGLSKDSAMKVADDYAARIMADRSFGQTPTLYNSKTLGLLTQFQLEVNNQLSFLGKDIPKMTEGNKLKLASTLGQVAIYGYIFDNIFEKATGRRPAIDPIGIAQSTYSDYKNNKKGLSKNLAENVANQLPYASTITGGGRIPLSAGIPNPFAVMNGDSTWKKEIKKPTYYILPPTGGGQLKKTIEGGLAVKNGYSQTDSGKVRFPVARTTGNAIKDTLFGQYASPEAQQYFKQGNKPLSANQSAMFKQLGGTDYYNQVMNDRKTNASAKAELASLQTNKGKTASKNVNGLTQLSNGKYAAKVGNQYKTFDTPEKAQIAVATDKLQKSDKNFMDLGDTVLRKAPDGTVKPQSKIDYNHDLNKAKMISYKKSKNIDSWMSAADDQFQILQTKLNDPNVDELDKITLQNELDTLVSDAAKYQNYGGFTKPKKGKKAKQVAIGSLSKVDLSTIINKPQIARIKAPKVHKIARSAPKIIKPSLGRFV